MLLLLACAGSPDSATPVGDSPVQGLPETQPVWTAAQAAERVEAALGTGLPVASQVVNELAEAIEQHGDPNCPGPGFELPSAFEGCQTPEGWRFGGVLEYDGEPPPVEAGEAFQLLGDGFVLAGDGDRFVLGGELEVSAGGTSIQGTWSWPKAQSAWLAQGFSGALVMADDGGLRSVAGGLQVGEADPLFLDLAEASPGCPMGAVQLRQGDGGWYELKLEDCQGCGALRFGEQDLGEACVQGLAELLAGQVDL
jgi:hypothetical protein